MNFFVRALVFSCYGGQIMTLTNAGYIVFYAAVILAYYIFLKKHQNAVLVVSSFAFYAFNLPHGENISMFQTLTPLAALCFNVLFTWYMAKKIGKSSGKVRFAFSAAAVAACVGVLCFFKYSGSFLPVLASSFGLNFSAIALPLGISFYTFATISYIVDVYRNDTEAEPSLLNYTAYVTFFGTITSGPICRAHQILPQLKKQRTFNGENTCHGFRLILFGFFKWVAIANVLGLYVNEIFKSSDVLKQYSGLSLMLAAAVYALQLYFEFSGYSDIARGSALILGIEIPENFKTPYLSTNFSAFWQSWHISLSTWLQDYVFMPLVWGRFQTRLPIIGKHLKDTPPVISSVAIVFIISGFWHGDTLPFVVWGLLQAAFRVGEELLHKWYKKPKKKPSLKLRIIKTCGVFVLWSQSLVFFRIGLMPGGTVADGFSYIARQFSNISVPEFLSSTSAAIQTGFYTRPLMVLFYTVYIVFVLSIAFYSDKRRCFNNKGRHICTALEAKPLLVRWAVYYTLIVFILLGFIMQSGGFGTVSFAYAQF